MWGAIVYLLLIAWVLTRQREVFWDEVPYLGQARLFHNAPSLMAWLRGNDAGPCGPLHPLMHYALAPGAGILDVPWVRLPNLLLLGATMLIVASALRRLDRPATAAIGMLAVPMTWVVAGLAITEMPAMFGMAVALWGALELGRAPTDGGSRFRPAAMLTLGLAAATLGRQTYLVTVPSLLTVAACNRRTGWLAVAAIGAGLLPVLALFAAWGGLVPPKLAFVGQGLEVRHAVLAVGITGLLAVILAPRLFTAHWRWSLGCGAAAATANVISGYVSFTTLSSAQRMLGNPAWARVVEASLSWVAVFAGTGLVAGVIAETVRRKDRCLGGLCVAVFALCAACAAVVHQFSSRYAVMALPFLIVALARWMDTGGWALLRYSGGALLGFAALRSYFLLAP